MSERLFIQTENVDVPELDWNEVERWISAVAKAHGCRVGQLVYIFCDDTKILEVNRQFLQHDYFTDIITFDYTRGQRISGDMFISLDTVKTNAETVGATYRNELLRVIIHGVLHLCGINDKGPGEREIMEAHENEALAISNPKTIWING
ncbi:MAG: rRNA maturation RNase YbeY [Muribaculaceae bacterium]|nr:rRNA maturation RNase YbeY [Muribaculaceae bacterium]